MLIDILKVLLTSLGSVTVLFLLTKLMGSRQISQLSMFDYINGITIGSIAAELAVSGDDDFVLPLVAMTVYSLLTVAIALATNKSVSLRKFLVGKPLVLYDKGMIYEHNLRKSRLDINEFLTHCRYEGYFDLNNVQTAILETNGMISFLPKSTARPIETGDVFLSPLQDKVCANVIIDGRIMFDCLRATGNNEQWLKNQLLEQSIHLEDVMLGICDGENVFTAFERANDGGAEKPVFI